MRSAAGGAHDSDDLFDLGRVCRVAQSLVRWCLTDVESRHRRRRSTPAGAIEQKLGHGPSSGAWTNPTIRGCQRAAEPAPALPAIASSIERLSEQLLGHYRGCLTAALSISP